MIKVRRNNNIHIKVTESFKVSVINASNKKEISITQYIEDLIKEDLRRQIK